MLRNIMSPSFQQTIATSAIPIASRLLLPSTQLIYRGFHRYQRFNAFPQLKFFTHSVFEISRGYHTSTNYYDILGTSKNASSEDIKKAYFAKAKTYHPDTGGSHAEFIKLQEAYRVLSNTSKKNRYDQYCENNSGGYDGNGSENAFHQWDEHVNSMSILKYIAGGLCTLVVFVLAKNYLSVHTDDLNTKQHPGKTTPKIEQEKKEKQQERSTEFMSFLEELNLNEDEKSALLIFLKVHDTSYIDQESEDISLRVNFWQPPERWLYEKFISFLRGRTYDKTSPLMSFSDEKKKLFMEATHKIVGDKYDKYELNGYVYEAVLKDFIHLMLTKKDELDSRKKTNEEEKQKSIEDFHLPRLK